MKKFFLILLINAPFLLNNTIKADTSQLFTLFDIQSLQLILVRILSK